MFIRIHLLICDKNMYNYVNKSIQISFCHPDYDSGRQTRLQSVLDWMDNLLREFECVEFLGKCEGAELG